MQPRMFTKQTLPADPPSPHTIAAGVAKPGLLRAAEQRLSALRAEVDQLFHEICDLIGRSAEGTDQGSRIKALTREKAEIESKIDVMRQATADARRSHAAAVHKALLPHMSGEAAEIVELCGAFRKKVAFISECEAIVRDSGGGDAGPFQQLEHWGSGVRCLSPWEAAARQLMESGG